MDSTDHLEEASVNQWFGFYAIPRCEQFDLCDYRAPLWITGPSSPVRKLKWRPNLPGNYAALIWLVFKFCGYFVMEPPCSVADISFAVFVYEKKTYFAKCATKTG